MSSLINFPSINLATNFNLRSNHPLPLHKCTHLIQFKQFHAQITKHNNSINTQLAKLVESLVAFSHIDYARHVFDQMSEPSVFAFNTMIRCYADNGSNNEAIDLYTRMRLQGLDPDSYTFPFLLKTCSDARQGKVVHALVIKSDKFCRAVHSCTCLLHFYCSYGDIESARLLFDRMIEKNVVSWTIVIAGYVKLKRFNEGLELFHQMRMNGIEINELTLVNVLSACARLGMYKMGRWVHLYIEKNGIFLNPILASSLIDMYVKCGFLEVALKVFRSLDEKSVCTWNSIIGGLAIHGHGHEALEIFEEMKLDGILPNDITFIGLLSACGHTGMVEKGKECFHSMRKHYDIEPKIKHYGCLVDILCRAGNLKEAYHVIKGMPMEPNGVVWGTLLTACASNTNFELALIAMEQLIVLEPFNDGNYVLMSNIYAKKGLWDEVARMRKFMREKRIVKTVGHSLIEIDNVVQKFMVGDSRHQLSKQITSMLELLDI